MVLNFSYRSAENMLCGRLSAESCHWKLAPLSALSILFPFLFLSIPSSLFSVFQFLDLCNSKSNLPVYGLSCVKCSETPSGKTQCIFRLLFISSTSSASNTGLLYKGISARWLILFVVGVLTFLALLH